ncbi:MAG: cytochrome c oxidase assembly protein [Actinobacteria bacterium]|nr:cytochrome c oxidase assembly protein [Actinomycetota bacterium]
MKTEEVNLILHFLAKFITLSSFITLIGILVGLAFLAPENKGYFQPSRLQKFLAPVSLAWLLSSIFFLLSEVAFVLNISIAEGLNGNILRSFITQTTLGKLFGIQIVAALVCAFAAVRAKKTGGAVFLISIAWIGGLAPYLESHGSSSGNHMLAIGLVIVHVAAISLWFGGVIALFLMPKSDREIARKRFTPLALWCVSAIALTGVVNAFIRIESFANIRSDYGLLVILKTLILIFVLTLVAQGRKKLGEQNFTKQLIQELILLTTVLVLGVFLGQGEPPEHSSADVVEAIGIKMPESPTLSRLLFEYEPDGLFLALLILAVALYVKGVIILSKRGDKWPIGRTVAFALGITAIDYAVNGGLGVYAQVAFSFHMISHMVLATLAPIGIVLGAPITLALRTLPIGRTQDERGVRGYAIAILHSRYSSIITHPVSALIIFEASLFALYFTNLFNWLMSYHFGHFFMGLHFLLSGILLFFVIIGVDPTPQKSPFIFRIVILFVAISIHAFFSVALMSSSQLVDGGYFAEIARPWWPDFLADQKMGASIGWAMGEIPILLALIATFLQWIRADERDAKRIERNSNRARQFGEPDELDKYNQYLSGLNQRKSSPDKTDKEANT